jgi:hypothetical protein
MSSYKSRGLLGGDVRFVLNSGGHIAGIVNPSNPKSRALTSDAIRRAPSSGATAQGSMRSPGGKIGRAGWPFAPVHSASPHASVAAAIACWRMDPATTFTAVPGALISAFVGPPRVQDA